MDILPLLEELQAIARTGLNYSTNPYEHERCARLLALACEYYGRALELPPAEVRRRLAGELGYITPKVGANAALFDPEGRVFLVRRVDDGKWCLPCGWVEPNESPEEAAVRETREETGLEVRIRTLVGVSTRKADQEYGPHSAIGVTYLCDLVGGSPRPSFEIRESGYARIEDVTEWHGRHRDYALAARAVWAGPIPRH
jgi:ADP-ribose pyrophosphatase YjhB (NUDIX family)